MLLHGLLQSTAPVGQLGDMAEMLSLAVVWVYLFAVLYRVGGGEGRLCVDWCALPPLC